MTKENITGMLDGITFGDENNVCENTMLHYCNATWGYESKLIKPVHPLRNLAYKEIS